MSTKTYSELITLPTFEERFLYLSDGLSGHVGEDTFGYDRYLNQVFYRSPEWRHLRDEIIFRDMGCDLAIPGYEIHGMKIIIHHMNPLDQDDIINQTEYLTNPEFLICTTHRTHNAIHYGDGKLLVTAPVERSRNDTCPWKR